MTHFNRLNIIKKYIKKRYLTWFLLEIDKEVFNIMLVKSMYQIAQIEFRNAKFAYARGLCPLATPARGPTPWTPVFVTNFTAPRGEAILDPPVCRWIVHVNRPPFLHRSYTQWFPFFSSVRTQWPPFFHLWFKLLHTNCNFLHASLIFWENIYKFCSNFKLKFANFGLKLHFAH